MTPRTAIEQIDEMLAAWDARLRRMDDNLVALEGEATYQILAGKTGKRAPLEGVTAARAGPALDAVTELFEHRGALEEVLGRARRVRASISALTFWESDDKIAEVIRLLSGPSIDLGERPRALGERSLLAEGHRADLVEPEALLAAMTKRFDEAREVLVAVGRALRAIAPEMARIEAEVAALHALAREAAPPGGERPAAAEIAEIEAAIAALRARAARDPLGLEGHAREAIAPRLAATAGKLEAAGATRRRAVAALDEARAAMRRLGADHARAVALFDRARREIEAPGLPAPLDEGQVLGLGAWLAKLEGTVAAGRWAPAEVGLARFHEAVAREQAAEAAAITRTEAAIALPAELAGRLSARRAQAAATAARGVALPREAEAAAQRAEACLRRRPVPIDEAARAVEAFEAFLVSLAGRR